jgi:tetratricopeptide (TPR) repeat protein
LILAVVGLYVQVGSHDFINFDDPEYVYANPHVQKGLSLASISWAISTTHAANWHPVTWLSHMLVAQLFALNPAAHHLANVLLHAANAALLFLILRSIAGGIWRSAVVAAFFALHPLHVESVAWVAELKDVLSTFFALLTISLYVWYLKQPNRRRYALMLTCFALGLMAKPMIVTLPVLLLLLDYWPLRRLGTVQEDVLRTTDKQAFWVLVREKVPLFTLVAASCAITIYAQKQGDAIRSLADSPLPARMCNALLAYLGYLGKTFWPHDLAVLYPFPADIPLWEPVVAGSMLAAITFLVVLYRKLHPYLFVGWFWYLCTLVPVIGLVRVGQQAMADRYTYLPLAGIFIMLVFGADKITAGWRCMLLEGLPDKAIDHFQTALKLDPALADGYYNMGLADAKQGKSQQAIEQFREALLLKPDDFDCHYYLGVELAKQGRYDDAIAHFTAIMSLGPDPEMEQMARQSLNHTLQLKGSNP